MTLIEIFVWCFSVFGAANGIAFSTLALPFRNWVVYKSWTQLGDGQIQGVLRDSKICIWLGKLIHCPMCLGFWVGMIFSIIWKSPSGGNYLIDAFLGSAISWVIYLQIANRQFAK